MLGIKPSGNFLLFCLVIVLGAVLGFYTARGSFPPRQEIFRFLVGQETRLKTAQMSEVLTDHCRIKYLPEDEPWIDMIANAAEEAYFTVSSQMGRKPQQLTTIVVYPDSPSLARSFGWARDEQAMGVYWGGTIRILSPREWLGNPEDQERFIKEGPMVHEFAHLIVDDITQGNYNRWWTEGIAQYVEKEITGFEFSSPQAGGEGVNYYTLEELQDKFDQLNQQICYWQSLKAVEFIADNYGEDCLLSILTCLGQGNSMEESISTTLGIDYHSFEYAYYQHLANN